MDWLNYHHLHYFWAVAREGSIARACEQLHLTQSTISMQLRELEKSLGVKLLERRGRTLALTETGKMAFDYADEIFGLGRELMDVLAERPSNRPARFSVGLPDVLPKMIAHRILEPVLKLPDRIQMVCSEGKLPDLLGEMAAHRLDLVISDAPIGPTSNLRAFNHLLGECGAAAFATPDLAARHGKSFPASLAEAPLLLPSRITLLRRSLDQWFDSQGIRPRIVAEFDDSALMKTFGQSGYGVFFGPAAIDKQIARQFGVRRLGVVESVRERFYAVTPERRIKHPAVVEILKGAREELFASG